MAVAVGDDEIGAVVRAGPMDLRRQAQIARAGPADHVGDAVLIPSGNFTLDKTIFHSVGGMARTVIRDRLAVVPFWSDAAAETITRLFSAVPKPLSHDKAILDFMANECNFAMEHADGSFMDHLQFCYEYGVAHFKDHSPRVLLLHSIMGVGTNFFPMELKQLPQLKALVTEAELMHMEAFPSILRLIYHGPLMEALSNPDRNNKIDGISYRRVLDNAPLFLGAEDFWVQLNYQLVHLLDFLPVSDWGMSEGDGFLHNFISLYKVLRDSGKLMAHVDLGLGPVVPGSGVEAPKAPVTLGGLIRNYAPTNLQLMLSRKQIAKFSGKIGHDLSFDLKWKSDL